MIEHSFVSQKTNGTDQSIVGPTAWNQDHTVLSPLQVLTALGGTILAQITWGALSTPNNGVVGSPGDIYLSSSGGAGHTFWVKETGVATNQGWVNK